MKHLVVIPAFNEELSLKDTIESLQFLTDDFEILIVNDGSRDGTAQVVTELQKTSRLPVRTVCLPLNSGIGVAVQTGYVFAAHRQEFQYLIQFDADGQHDAAAIPRLIETCDELALDLCIGSRFLDADADAFRSTWSRRLGIRLLSRLITVLTGTRVTDPTSGLRCAGPRAWNWFAQSYGEDYPEPEALFWCIRNGLKVKEIPVCMSPRQHGTSSIRSLDAIYYMAKVSFTILIDSLRSAEGAER